MAIELNLEELVIRVGKIDPETALDKYIAEAVFPNFKNIEPGTRLVFEYPITFLVGANGSGKSSILHALWGMPLGYSTSRFWFSTALDPIKEGGKHGLNRYWYAHWIEAIGKYVQTKKLRGKRRGNQGYWEPARAMTNDGMDAMPVMNKTDAPFRALDRWTPAMRQVCYINFKCEISAFDRLLYFAPKKMTIEERQALLRKGSLKLQSVINGHRASYKPGGKEAVFEHRILTPEELKYVSFILGREYTSATYVLHRLYGGMEAPSVLFKRAGLTYTDAFAGSGELAIVRVVLEILDCENNCLVLLDEPETSLHPGAQERLLCFLLEQILKKRLQIVASTHAPTMIEKFPARAIKAMEETASGRMVAVDVTHPSVAFNRLGAVLNEQILLTIEDDLLAALVEIAMIDLDPGELEAIRLYIPPAGADDVLKNLIPLWVHEGRDCFAMLDGDKQPNPALPDPDTLTPGQQKTLYKTLCSAIGVKPLYLDKDDFESVSKYVKWINSRLFFLDAICPEYVVLEAILGHAPGHVLSNQQAKDELNKALSARHLDANAYAKRLIAKQLLTPVRQKNRYVRDILISIKSMIRAHQKV